MNKFARLVDFFVSAIERGNYRPGDALPSLRASAQTHAVSLNTVKRAYWELERLGFAEARAREGFKVIAGALPAPVAPPLAGPWGSPFVNPALFDTRALGEAATRAMRGYGRELAEPQPYGLPALRRQLARRYRAEGIALDWCDILISCGAMEALSLAVQAVTLGQPSPRLAVLTPAFPGLLGLLAQQGIAVLAVPVDAAGHFDPVLLEDAAGSLCGIAAMPSFQHPTGVCLADASRAALLDIVRRHDLPLIEDDSYRALFFGAAPPRPLIADDADGRVLHCSGFSKTLAPGYRVGWIAPGRWRERVGALKASTTLASPLPSQMAIAELLADGAHEGMQARLRGELAARVAAMRDALLPHLPGGCRLHEPAGGYFLWLELPPGACEAACVAAAQAQGIFVAPGALCQPPGSGRPAMRLNASYYEAPQAPALETLASLLS
ncbi:PLP-dependent aminotransferase family protein [Crenobacter cavernae]|uniref:Putative 8-amino-7-oxononanoate synthase n=1 Tax=Crenobacter cavernae TaxID=2290923 RepID=A0ABY0FH31_9NEIS|nr:PLP-dependent aminotransferase family protein [Crenobacter cavernae]RXZ44379.1 PLP-dependent aminotransferase family protein [Crenobacter cavernae]